MQIEDFLPPYPNIEKSQYEVLNPYEDETFETVIYKKKEFYDNRLEKIEDFPTERGMLMKHQKIIERFLSSHTPYDRLLVVHAMGTGKTCSVIGAIEQIKEEHSSINGAIIVAKGDNILRNFKNELIYKCTPGQYIPDNYEQLTRETKTRRENKAIGEFYSLRTMQKFAKEIGKMPDSAVHDLFSNKIMIIDEIHNLRIQKVMSDMKMYTQFHRLAHLVENCKIVLLSGTPMKDGVEEIASVMNLLLPMNEQLPTEDDFRDEFLDDDQKNIKPDKIPILKKAFRGKVSFLRSMQSDVEKRFIGEIIPPLQYLTVYPSMMSEFQSDHYENAYNLDVGEDTGRRSGVYNNSREASLFVFPDGSFGKAGFTKYVKLVAKKKLGRLKIGKKGKKGKSAKAEFQMTNELKNALVGETPEKTLENLYKYSSKYAQIVRDILEAKDKCCFVYSSIIRGSGLILLSLILKLFGYLKTTGSENSVAPRFALLTGDSSSSSMQNITRRFNRDDNAQGKYIQVILGSRAISEGYSFKNIQKEFIITPYFNYTETAQAIARGIRLGSHNALLELGIKPIIDIYQTAAISENGNSMEIINMYKVAEDKDIIIRRMIRLIMEASFDCALNFERNIVTDPDKNNTRECDYMQCTYTCDNIAMGLIDRDLDKKEIDYSSYQVYYTAPRVANIHIQIERILREYPLLNTKSIVRILEGEFTEWEVKKALREVTEGDEEKQIDYREFLNIYAKSPLKKISIIVERMFRTRFQLGFEDLMNEFKDEYTYFEVLSSLDRIINENIGIMDRYGFICYLREDRNNYFLVNSLAILGDVFSSYYTENPTLQEKVNKRIGEEEITESIVKTLLSVTHQDEFRDLIKLIPLKLQENFLEASIVSKKDIPLRRYILDYFSAHIRNINGILFSDLLQTRTGEGLRCNKGGTLKNWRKCDKKEELLFFEDEKKKENVTNEYKILGKWNRQNGKFCIQILQEGIITDARKRTKGRVCTTMNFEDLIKIAIVNLNLPVPNNFTMPYTRRDIEKYYKSSNVFKYLRKLYSLDDIKRMSEGELRQAMKWGTSEGFGTRPALCGVLKKEMENRGIVDDKDVQCGVTAKKRLTFEEVKSKQVKSKKRGYAYFKLTPSINITLYESIKPRLDKFGETVTEDLLKYDNDVFHIAKKNILSGVFVEKDGRFVYGYITPSHVKNAPAAIVKNSRIDTITVSKTDQNYGQLIRRYKSYGFEEYASDANQTIMKFKK